LVSTAGVLIERIQTGEASRGGSAATRAATAADIVAETNLVEHVDQPYIAVT